MKAFLLSAGYGSRLRPLTYFTNKCMIKVDGKPVMEYLVDHLRSFGITEIMTNIHYRPQDVYGYFGSRLAYFYEPKLLGEEGTLRAVAPWFNDYTVVMNGDTLTNVNIKKMFECSRGESISLMDNVDRSVYAGTRIIKPYYQSSKEVYYQDSNAEWLDIGTWPNLFKAGSFFKNAKKSNILS